MRRVSPPTALWFLAAVLSPHAVDPYAPEAKRFIPLGSEPCLIRDNGKLPKLGL